MRPAPWTVFGASLVLAASCAEPAAPRWLRLAEGFTPRSPAELVEAWSAGTGAGAVTLRPAKEPAATGTWFERELEASVWSPVADATANDVARFVTDLAKEARGTLVRLRSGASSYRRIAPKSDGAGVALEEDTYCVFDGRLWLGLPMGETPADGLRLGTFLDRGREVDGTWRVEAGDYVGEGLPLAIGVPEELVCDVPPDSALRFFTAGRRFDAEDGRASVATFRVQLDGVELFAHEQPTHPLVRGVWHTLDLPAKGRHGARLSFSLTGDPCEAAVLAPVIGPRAVGAPGARPWSRGAAARPNVVLFLADTLRADGLATWGGEAGNAPTLNALAENSLAFRNAYSPAAWTLPAQATMLTGLWPPTHGAERVRTPIHPDLVTLAEHLAHYGYRTGAITDSGFVSREFGFDQGFAWFEENTQRDLQAGLERARAFLANDDGRPSLLFFQTYRVHAPYREGTDEDGTRWIELVTEVEQRVRAQAARLGPAGWPSKQARDAFREEVMGELVDVQLELYRAAVRALDASFAAFWQGLEDDGLRRNTALCFTSDHGEAFLEHGELRHGGKLWEEKIRVPLFLHGPDVDPRLAPGLVEHGASLVDIPRTLAALCRVPPASGWRGKSLFDLTAGEAVFAFGAELQDLGKHMVVVHDGHKLFTSPALEDWDATRVEAAYALETDPGEQYTVNEAPWVNELLAEFRHELERILSEAIDPAAIQLGRDKRSHLKALGYLGEGVEGDTE